MIQKIILTAIVVLVLLFGLRFLRKITTSHIKSNNADDNKVVDLEKDPKTDEYKPKE